MGSKDRYNPIQTLTTIMDRHDGKIDPTTMQSYLSFVSFLSLLNIYQSFAPQVTGGVGVENDDLSGMLNQFMGKASSTGSSPLASILGDKQGLASFLSSVPPETMAKVSSMLGGMDATPKKQGNPLGGLLSTAMSNPALLSMLGGGGGLGGGGLGGGGLGSLLGGLGGSGIAPLLGGLGGGGLGSLLGGGKGAGPLGALLGGGGKGSKGLGALGGLADLSTLAPLLPYVSSAGKVFGKKIKKSKQRRRDRRAARKGTSEKAPVDQLTSMLEKSGKLGKYAPLMPQLMAIASTGNTGNALPFLLPFVMDKNVQKHLKKTIGKKVRPTSVKSHSTVKNAKVSVPVNNDHQMDSMAVKKAPVKSAVPPRKTAPVVKSSSSKITKPIIIEPNKSIRYKLPIGTSLTKKPKPQGS